MQFARIGHALASPKRIEILDLSGQGEKTVERWRRDGDADQEYERASPRTSPSALVETRRDGTYVCYRLADDDVSSVVRTRSRRSATAGSPKWSKSCNSISMDMTRWSR